MKFGQCVVIGSALLVASPFLAGCATEPSAPPEPVTARSLADDYILVHGMAAGALTSGAATDATYAAMVRLDRDALLAVGSSVTHPQSPELQVAAEAAIERLADYAGAVGDGNAPKAPGPRATP